MAATRLIALHINKGKTLAQCLRAYGGSQRQLARS